MPHKSFKLNNEILRSLAQNHNRSFTLEELTTMVSPYPDLVISNNDPIAVERENQARVLEALLFLADHGLIFLNPFTDQSCIR
jgi:hypothetical protein